MFPSPLAAINSILLLQGIFIKSFYIIFYKITTLLTGYLLGVKLDVKVIARIIKSLQKENPAGPSSVSLQGSKKSMAEKIPANIKDVKAKIRREFDRCEDLVIRALEIGENNFITMLVVYIDGMVDKQILNSHVLRPLLIDARTAPLAKTADKRTIVNIIERNLLDNCEVLELTDYKQSVDKILRRHGALH